METDPAETSEPAGPLSRASAKITAPPVSPRTIRWIELGLLLAVAFGGLLYQTAASLSAEFSRPSTGPYNWPLGLVRELTSLALCAYLLHKQGRSFQKLGLTWDRLDLLYGASIMFLHYLPSFAVTSALHDAGLYSAAAYAAHTTTVSRLYEAPFALSMVIFQMVNAFFEELIVRAYLMTDITFLTGSTVLAVIVSSALQGSYHLYQGWQAALALTAGFMVFSVFYAWFGRITPIIIAHMLWDLWWYVDHVHRYAYHQR